MLIEKRLQTLALPAPAAIIGAGVTGKSCFELLQSAGVTCRVFDESDTIPECFSAEAQHVALGEFNAQTFDEYATILLSPGVDTRRECFSKHEEKLLTDIELFARLTAKPVVGVTGSNGKSTVVSLIHVVTQQAGKDYALCGNIGLPVLSALRDSEETCDGYIIELSSYHLERSPSLRLNVGVWLNVSPDHLDRYESYREYIETKAKILPRSENIVANADDREIHRYLKSFSTPTLFSRTQTNVGYFLHDECIYHNVGVEKPIFSMHDFPQMGAHYADDVMAVFAVAHLLGISTSDIAAACRSFAPLASRSVLVGEKNGVSFINDSKGTNVGATVAAIEGLQRPIILIAGGQAKGQNFEQLANAGRGKLKALFLIGEDAQIVHDALAAVAPCTIVSDLQQAVTQAIAISESGDIVLLSPACSSFDMFRNYLARGEVFEQLVRSYLHE